MHKLHFTNYFSFSKIITLESQLNILKMFTNKSQIQCARICGFFSIVIDSPVFRGILIALKRYGRPKECPKKNNQQLLKIAISLFQKRCLKIKFHRHSSLRANTLL